MNDHSGSSLREAPIDAADPVAARAAWLLRAEEPLPPSAEMIDRVRRVVLAQPPVPPRWGGAWRMVPSPKGAALAVGTLAAVGLFAWWWSHDAATPVAAVVTIAPSTVPVDVGARRVATSGSENTAVAAAPAPLAPSPPPASPLLPARVPSRPRAAGQPAAATHEIAAPIATPPVLVPAAPAVPAPATPVVPASPVTESATRGSTDTDGAELLVKATRLLRHEDDPVAARALIERYLAGHPDGVLAEEALYLDVEAAGALQDGTLPPLAARYLARYPHGRFRSAVIGLRDGR